MSAGQEPRERDEGEEPLAPADREAVAAIYAELSDRLLAYIRTRVPDAEIAEDLLEQTFLQLIRRAPRIRGGPETVELYLFRIATHVVVDHLRKVARRPEELIADYGPLDAPDPDQGPDDLAAVADTTERVRRAIEQLSADQRTVLQLRYAGGLSAPEIARVLGKNEAAIRSLQHRGERSLARLLSRHAHDYDETIPPPGRRIAPPRRRPPG
jgi:RNA polymerase sigma-70 factor, ECF subfamily